MGGEVSPSACFPAPRGGCVSGDFPGSQTSGGLVTRGSVAPAAVPREGGPTAQPPHSQR